MITPCSIEKGCGKILPASKPVPGISYDQMTNYTTQSASNVPSYTGMIAATVPVPETAEDLPETIPGQPDSGASMSEVSMSPKIKVPGNPLLPPGYEEVIDYDNLQYLNGFLRTQIGKYVRIEQLVGATVIEDRYGYLVGVGANYVLLQELGTGNIIALDYYNIKYVYVYYTNPDLPTNGSK